MSEEASTNQLIIGLPGVGKTTFIAAFWHVVESGEVPQSLQLEYLHGKTDYLNEIRKLWVSGQHIGRTSQNAEQVVAMRLITADGKESTELIMPDMSGESFEQQWEERRWTREYDDIARKATGILLFVHPYKIKPVARIADVVVPKDNEQDQDEQIIASVPWTPKAVPTQVRLVELLQFLSYDPHSFRIRRISLIVSAWDLVDDYKDPESWLAKELPFLYQYLKANSDFINYRAYGVSAQGGDLDNEANRLLKYHKPSDRIVIVGQNCQPHDITAPIKWLMGRD